MRGRHVASPSAIARASSYRPEGGMRSTPDRFQKLAHQQPPAPEILDPLRNGRLSPLQRVRPRPARSCLRPQSRTPPARRPPEDSRPTATPTPAHSYHECIMRAASSPTCSPWTGSSAHAPRRFGSAGKPRIPPTTTLACPHAVSALRDRAPAAEPARAREHARIRTRAAGRSPSDRCAPGGRTTPAAQAPLEDRLTASRGVRLAGLVAAIGQGRAA
jgi:hypothetical protein